MLNVFIFNSLFLICCLVNVIALFVYCLDGILSLWVCCVCLYMSTDRVLWPGQFCLHLHYYGRYQYILRHKEDFSSLRRLHNGI